MNMTSLYNIIIKPCLLAIIQPITTHTYTMDEHFAKKMDSYMEKRDEQHIKKFISRLRNQRSMTPKYLKPKLEVQLGHYYSLDGTNPRIKDNIVQCELMVSRLENNLNRIQLTRDRRQDLIFSRTHICEFR